MLSSLGYNTLGMEHVIVQPRKPRNQAQPLVPCPNCSGANYVNEDWCWRCSMIFREGQLRAIYEETLDR